MNIRFRDLTHANSIPLTYEEGPGGHTWDFWDQYICRAFNWLDQNLIQGKQLETKEAVHLRRQLLEVANNILPQRYPA
jgi:hypothetical protein